MQLICQDDQRRDAIRRLKGWNGLDYVEVSEDQRELSVYFLGKLPPELAENKPGIERYLQIEGGQRVIDIRIIDIDPVVSPDPEVDDHLVVRLDKYGDFSTYTLRLVDVENIDPRYDHVDFSFKIDCPSDLDCAPACYYEPPQLPVPEINYLAKDYASFRQLILDRLAVLIPEWREQHVSDFVVTLVELLAYTGDYLSYYQDAVATEAYLATARQRISVRRHARLVDYFLHEGCNSRAWVCVGVSSDVTLERRQVSFVTGLDDLLSPRQTVLNWSELRGVSPQSYMVFEPKPLPDSTAPDEIELYSAHSEIYFYTWGNRKCCLERGSTTATLLNKGRALKLKKNDVLIFEEISGPKTGLSFDADPTRRHVVRLTKVTYGEDLAVLGEDGHPTPYAEIEWTMEDTLPFPIYISAVGPEPEYHHIDNISVARGNVILVDLGKTLDPEYLGEISVPRHFRPHLGKMPLTFSAPFSKQGGRRHKTMSCTSLLEQDVRDALPSIRLVSLSSELRRYFPHTSPGELEYTVLEDKGLWWLSFPTGQLPPALVKRFPDGRLPADLWEPRFDLLASSAEDRHFVAEIDDDGIVHLRFGDGELGRQPSAGTLFFAVYRVGNGVSGNIGAESISRLVLKNIVLGGVSVTVRNPLPVTGGRDSEPLAEAKLYAPRLFRKDVVRAITADDYQQICEDNLKIQRASAALSWTGSWYEADVAIDPRGVDVADKELLDEIKRDLHRLRRIGHDLHVKPAIYVPIDLKLEVGVLPHYQRGHIKAALLAIFSNRLLPGGKRGFFHPDNLNFGESIYVSKLVAAVQAVTGVESVRVVRLQRLFESANLEIENGVLPIRADEIARLNNDPNYPEYGKLDIQLQGGR